MAKSRSRPATDEAEPPAKRARANGYANLLLNDKQGKKLAPAYTTKDARREAARVGNKGTTVNTADGHGDVDMSLAPQKAEVVDISSDSSSSSGSDDDDEEATEEPKLNGQANGLDEELQNGTRDSPEPMEEDPAGEEGPSFGELMKAAEPIDVEAALARGEDGTDNDKQKPHSRMATMQKITNIATFTTLLSQALRTNDHALLESCFEVTDLEGVRDTIQRLASLYVIRLLDRMAERISNRPGRLGNLMVWVQWALIAHGGYLAYQPDMVVKMGKLLRIIKDRAGGLQSLLQLKGKLDMLAAQLDLRREMREKNAREEQDDEGAVTVYFEGQEDVAMAGDDGSDSDAQAGAYRTIKSLIPVGSDAEEEDAGVFANGAVKADPEDSDDDEEEEGLFDDEAEETDNDDEDDEEEESEEDDEEGSDDSD